LITPALILDAPALRRNIALMESALAGKARLRPHAKTHKSPDVARLQVEAGAIGITTATVWEALAMAEAGLSEILVANEVVGPPKIEALARAATLAEITVAVDSQENARDLSTAALAAGVILGVVVEVDVGLGRCGVRSLDEAIAVAATADALKGLYLRGVMGYEGHCTFERDRQRRAAAASAAMSGLLAVASGLRQAGFEIAIVSAGGTGTYDMTGSTPGVTEIQAGSYAFMDTSHAEIVSGFETALTVLATVISRHGRTIVLDAGRKTIGLDNPPPALRSYQAELSYVAEEHTVLQLEADEAPAVGTQVELVTSYCPVAVNLHRVYHIVEGNRVVDQWPIVARGSGQH
jgi:D-serine deaminase-like pyridoxal phosphate-dependent protein